MKKIIGVYALLVGLLFLTGIGGCWMQGRTVVIEKPGATPAPVIIPGPVTHEKTVIMVPKPADPIPAPVVRETVLVVPVKEKPAPPAPPVEIKVNLNHPNGS